MQRVRYSRQWRRILEWSSEAGKLYRKSCVIALCPIRIRASIAMVSTDNCSHNGTKLFDAVYAYANAWLENGLVDKKFVDYVTNPEKVSFPWSMIDKITHRPDASVEELLAKDGLEELEPVVTSKNTHLYLHLL